MKFPVMTKEDVVKILNDRVRVIQTTVRGGNRRTRNVVLNLHWESSDDEIFLAHYRMIQPCGDTDVNGAFFTTEEKRASCLPFLAPRDIIGIIEARLMDVNGLDRLYKYVKVEESSDGLLIQGIWIPLVNAAC